MSGFGIVVIFTVIWWVVFLMSLPFGVARIENPDEGHDAGAPDKPRLIIKAAVTTAITLALTIAMYMASAYDLIDFRQFVVNL